MTHGASGAVWRLLVYARVYARMVLLILLRRPYKLSLLVSGGCNLRCHVCSIWRSEKTALALDGVRRIWEAFRVKPCWINLSGGEPLLNPELESILSFFVGTRRPLLITLTSNGFADCSAMVDRILRRNRSAIVYVSLSFDGEQPDHDRARGRSGSFARVSRTYQNLRTLQDEFPALKVGISATVSRMNHRRLLPFIERTLRECPTLSVNLAQSSDYYRNSANDDFHDLPAGELVALLRATQRLLPKLNLDSFVKINFFEQAIRHLQGRYTPVPCTSYLHNVLVTSDLALVDCTVQFQRWPQAGDSREARLASIAEAIRRPALRAKAIRARIRASGCEQWCHTPCEKYVHIIAALLNPLHALRLLSTYARVCFRSLRREHRRGGAAPTPPEAALAAPEPGASE